MVIYNNKYYSILIDEESNDNTEIQIPEIKAKHEVVNSQIVAKCQNCQALNKVIIENISPNIDEYSCRRCFSNENSSKANTKSGQDNNARCICKCISLATKRSTGILCPKPNYSNPNSRHVCCIHCANPFRFYSLYEKAHCAHCSIFSKLLLAIAEIIFFVSIFLPLLASFASIVGLIYKPLLTISRRNESFLTNIVGGLILIISTFTASAARFLVGYLERPFTIKDFKTKLNILIEDDNSAALKRASMISILEKKTESQIMTPKPVVIKCQHCQKFTEMFVKKLLPKTAECNYNDKIVIKALPGQEYIRCLCNYLMSADKKLTEICCPKPYCNEIIKERRPCCTDCLSSIYCIDILFKDPAHCSHCDFVSITLTSITAVVITSCIVMLPQLIIIKLIILSDYYTQKLFENETSDEKVQEKSSNLHYNHQSNFSNNSPAISILSCENYKQQHIDHDLCDNTEKDIEYI